MSEQRLRQQLIQFDAALGKLAPDVSEEDRQAFTDAVWGLMEALLDRVTLIAYRFEATKQEAAKQPPENTYE